MDTIQNMAVNVEEPSHAELLERVREISRAAEGRADQTNSERKVPEQTIKEFYDAGLMRVVQPRKWGGLGRSPMEHYELIYEASKHCASTGWVYAVLSGHSDAIGLFPDSAQAAVWGNDPNAVASSAFAPTLRATKTEGGFEVSGKSPFSSGSDYASWAMLGGLVMSEDGPPVPKLFLIPRSGYTIIDDWFVMGLAGTGSKTLEVAGAFVPEDRVLELPDFFGGPAPLGLLTILAGAAKGAIDGFAEQISKAPGKFGGRPPSEMELFQAAIGSALGDVTFAWELIQKLTLETITILMTGQPVPKEQVLRNRAGTSLATRLCVGALEKVFEISGGQGIYNGRLSRAYRDVRAGANHAALNATLAAKDAGALVLKRT